MSSLLSDYERKRAENIERNNSRLRALGLISAHEEHQSNALARGMSLGSTPSAGRHNNKKRIINVPSGPIRKSRRLQGETPDDLIYTDNQVEFEISYVKKTTLNNDERLARVQECREARLRLALEIANASNGANVSQNPTATYEHCRMRVHSMTHNALANRVKAIERAAGKHCVIKMAIFKSCLQDEGLWELADLASFALERLKVLLPPPEKK
jgi:hypothetical protein